MRLRHLVQWLRFRFLVWPRRHLHRPIPRGFSRSGIAERTQRLVIVEDRRLDCNANRPHSAHDELTPNEVVLHWTTTHQPQAA